MPRHARISGPTNSTERWRMFSRCRTAYESVIGALEPTCKGQNLSERDASLRPISMPTTICFARCPTFRPIRRPKRARRSLCWPKRCGSTPTMPCTRTFFRSACPDFPQRRRTRARPFAEGRGRTCPPRLLSSDDSRVLTYAGWVFIVGKITRGRAALDKATAQS